MTTDEARKLLAAHLDGGEHVRRCIEALSEPTTASFGPSVMSAREALDLWTLRSHSLSRAGVSAGGLSESLRVLGGLGYSQPVVQQTFMTESYVVVVLVSGRDGGLVGCFLKPQRGTPGGGPLPPPLGPEFGGRDTGDKGPE